MNREKTIKHRFARWSVRVLAVLLVTVMCAFSFISFETKENVAEAATTFTMATPYFNKNGTNLKSDLSNMAVGESIICFLRAVGNGGGNFLTYHPFSKISDQSTRPNLALDTFDSTKYTNHSFIESVFGSEKRYNTRDFLWRIEKTSYGFVIKMCDQDRWGTWAIDRLNGANSNSTKISTYYYHASDVGLQTSCQTWTIVQTSDGYVSFAAYGTWNGSTGAFMDFGTTSTVDLGWAQPSYTGVHIWNSAPSANTKFQILPVLHSMSDETSTYGYISSGSLTSTLVSKSNAYNLSSSATFVDYTTSGYNTRFTFSTASTNDHTPNLYWRIKTGSNAVGFSKTITGSTTISMKTANTSADYSQQFLIIYSMSSEGGYHLMMVDDNGNGTLWFLQNDRTASAGSLGLSSQTFYFKNGTVSTTYTKKNLTTGATSSTTVNLNFNTAVSGADYKSDIPAGYHYVASSSTTINTCNGGKTFVLAYEGNTYTMYFVDNFMGSTASTSATWTYNGGNALPAAIANKTGNVTLSTNYGSLSSSTLSPVWTFNGWNTKADGSGTTYAAGKKPEKDFASAQGATVTLYAQWKVATEPTMPTLSANATLSFNSNGGSSVSSVTKPLTFNGWYSGNTKYTTASSAYAAKATTLTASWTGATFTNFASPTKTGYTFASWSESDSSNTNTTSITTLTDIALYAWFTANTYKVKYVNNFMGSEYSDEETWTYDEEYELHEAFEDITKTLNLVTNYVELDSDEIEVKWVFAGWKTDSEKTSADYAVEDKASNLASEQDDIVILYAHWEVAEDFDNRLPDLEASIKVELNANGGEVPYGFLDGDLEFLGWFKEGNKESYFLASEALEEGVETLTAEWIGASIAEGDIPIPTRDGFIFYGWSENGAPTSAPCVITEISELFEDITLNAYWLKASSNVKDENPKDATFTADVGFYGTEKITLTDVTPTLQWIRVGSSGETEVGNGETYTVTDDDKGHAIKCIAAISANGKEAKSEDVSALYVGDTLVDATTMGDESKEEYIKDFELNEESSGDNVYTYTGVADRPISQMNLDINGTYTYALYGIWGENKVLILTGNQTSQKALLNPMTGVSMEGEIFDSYELVITASEGITINSASIRYLPRVYALLEKNPINAIFEYLVSDGVYAEGWRTTEDNKKYFYEGDSIQIKLPISSDKKLTAGSYILIGNEKVFPAESTSMDGYITVGYKNALDYLLKNYPNYQTDKINKEFIQFKKSDLIIDLSRITTTDNSDTIDKNLNFGSLGVKILEDESENSTFVRFGTVWYFDDIASGNTWSREDAMGTFVIRLKTILRCMDGTNDFYRYLLINDKEFLNEMLEARDSNGDLSAEFLNAKEAEILKRLNAFLAEWEIKGEEDDAYARKPSFGKNASGKDIASDCEAKYYYYDVNEKDQYLMEYSAVLEVPSNMYDEKLIYIPYVSYVKGTEHWVVQKPDEIKVYQLGSVNEVYTVNGIISGQ